MKGGIPFSIVLMRKTVTLLLLISLSKLLNRKPDKLSGRVE